MALLARNNDISALVGRAFTIENVQSLVRLRDAADLIIIDTVMNQQDRFGNIHSRQTYYYLDRADPNPDGSPKLKSASTLTPAQIAQLGAVKVKTLLLKDNDCGVSKSNVAMQAGLLDRVAHIDPETYRHVLQFDATAGSPKNSRFFPPRTRLHFQRLCQYSQEPKGRGNQAPSKMYSGSPEARSGHASPLLWTTIDSRGIAS